MRGNMKQKQESVYQKQAAYAAPESRRNRIIRAEKHVRVK